MTIYPRFTLTVLNGFLLIIPLLVLRFGIPALVRKQALAELDYFPPAAGLEKAALKVYFVTNTFLVFSPLLARIQAGALAAVIGWLVYGLGLILMTMSLLSFSETDGLVSRGVYRYSRNPMCIGYFLIYLGVALLIGSWFHLTLAIICHISVHWLILSEERWCEETFGQAFVEYHKKVPRYL